jgi:hypothetical protein
MGQKPSQEAGSPEYLNSSPYPNQGAPRPFMYQMNRGYGMGRNVSTVKNAYTILSDPDPSEVRHMEPCEETTHTVTRRPDSLT